MSLRTVLIGCGKIGASYGEDPVMAQHYPFATHAQVLAAHPDFEWVGAFDRDEASARAVADRWQVAAARDFRELRNAEVAVLAIPPAGRVEAIEALPQLRAVVVEKPLGESRAAAENFIDACERRGIVVQVNLPRRADTTHRELADGELFRRIGRPQGAFLAYGNGLANNGTHMIDLARWFLGEVEAVQVPAGGVARREGPIDGDVNVPFVLRHRGGILTFGQPLAFANYRENMIDIWGEQGRLALMQEGLRLAYAPRRDNRAMQGERELENDAPSLVTTSIGRSFYAIYDDLASALRTGIDPSSTSANALRNASVVDAIRQSATRDGALIDL